MKTARRDPPDDDGGCYTFKSVPGDKIKGEGKIEGGERFGQEMVSVFI